MLVPWSSYWEGNYFAESMPILRAIMANDFVRGAVSGIGVLNLLAGLADLRTLLPWSRQ